MMYSVSVNPFTINVKVDVCSINKQISIKKQYWYSIKKQMEHRIQVCASKPDIRGERPMNIDQQVMSILRTVLERCKIEKSSNCLQVPLEDYYERVSFYTTFPKMFIYHIVDDENHYVEDSFSDDDHVLLMDCINTFLAYQSYLRIKDLYEEFLKCKRITASDNKYVPDFKTFEKKIYSFGYVYKKNLKGPPLILIENPKLKFERYNYLYKLKSYRDSDRHIYYLDDQLICCGLPFKNPLRGYMVGGSKVLDGLMFFHMISASGYEYGIFVSQEADKTLEEIFKKWMVDIILYSIKPGSVIVMASNFIHGAQPNKPITRYHSKKDMLQWLKENNVPCDPSMNKPRLYELIEKCTANNEDYDIDRIFKLHGHDILRLPTTFPSLTPTKYMWDYLNLKFKQFDLNLLLLQSNLLTYLSQLDKQAWAGFIAKTIVMEDKIFGIDMLTESLIEDNYELDKKCFYEVSSNFNIQDILE